MPSGTHRFVFYTRPFTDVPFFELPVTIREEQAVIADSTFNLSAGEVYTLNVLEKEVGGEELSTLLYLRQERFHKMAFADSLLYVNFYNLSAVGYVDAHPEPSAMITNYDQATGTAIKEHVNIYYSLYRDDIPYPFTLINNQRPRIGFTPVPGHQLIPLQQLTRSQEPIVTPYNTIPLFLPDDTTGNILSRHWVRLDIVPPGGGGGGLIGVSDPSHRLFAPANGTIVSLTNLSDEGRTQLYTGGSGNAPGFFLPSLIRQAASGPYRQRSFATVSTIEFINKQVYMTSVMKTYDPPIN
ncbi:hypothetical protein SAMN05421747_12616 [Parapedobacter composti]|uniref:Uncharacterized protein n=1 Tax=Parapedobacter composti TaxID=623281 RepID=A0A1I1M5W8_9SPHI|nr:hypothetical protein SAMN05421747_12616 [Parapedobacter composti]